ncbi:MAG: MerR family DNA-binding transcriptional regulator [Acidiferrobacterales bacterium]|nr:MerR family DNA-binding transcriptional regulator [Acidiferrobacterales bacterium]
MTTTYTISQLSEQFDLTSRTIRFYEDQGLLTPERAGTKRIYHDRDRVRLRLIMRAKRLGFSLSEIRETFGLYDSASGETGQMKFVLDVIAKRRAVLQQQQEDILHVLQDMQNVEQRILDKMQTLDSDENVAESVQS